ncbi:hypothetical protein [Arthrobacter sp. AL12]|uniref:hypothetical protein n=1 Tax=Arthrobacter sp. AL12 TaxID=3042241 RepID=UPI00249B0CF8|nr:hypothetical protein [Arthrobacter sp. AL12]MDI3214071.1 hypothetical protein [Arthrobacter sp. AL12]
MTSSYDRGGSTSTGASREHIERALLGYGATDVLFSQLGDRSAIAFRGDGRQFRIVLSLPQLAGTSTVPGGTAEDPAREAKAKILERATRRFWHALALAIDAKLGAAAAGTATLESEFLAHVVLPGNRTVLNELEPIIAAAYRSGLHPSFGDPAPSLPVSGGRLTAESPHRRRKVAPTVLDPAQSLQELTAQGVGRILHNMVKILGDRDNFTSQQMLELIDQELGQDQRREEPAAHHLKPVGPTIRGSNLRPVHAPEQPA